MSKKAFFPAAGFGTRMQEWTRSEPKPLLKVNQIPLIYYSLFWGKYWGVENGIVNTHYLSERIKEELKNFTEFEIHISEEKKEILGTGGGIRTGIERFWKQDDDFLVINPDFLLFSDPTFSPWPTEIEKERFDCILYLAKSSPGRTYTGLSLGENGEVRFEKGGYFYLGLSWMRGDSLSEIQPETYYDLADTFRDLSEKGKLGGKVFSGDFLDLGEKEFYESFRHTDFSSRLPMEWASFRENIFKK